MIPIDDDHVYHKLSSTNSPLNCFNIDSLSRINNEIFVKVLSPMSSCNDSGYESAPSPTLSFDNEDSLSFDDDIKFNIDQSFTELFPDLV